MKNDRNFPLLLKLTTGSLLVGIGIAVNVPHLQEGLTLTTPAAQAQTRNLSAAQSQAKPTLVKISAEGCHACQKLKGIISSLEKQYGNRVNFVVLDVSDRSQIRASEAKAAQLGLSEFFKANRSRPSTVAIIEPGSGKISKEFRANFDLKDYQEALDRALAQANR
jgi:thiol-disulfide isomerase/thioredoxin